VLPILETRSIICLHEASHAVFALEYGFRVLKISVGRAPSRTGRLLLGYTDYWVEAQDGVTEEQLLGKRAVIAYSASAVVGQEIGVQPISVIECEDDDMQSIRDFVTRLREIGATDEKINKWRKDAWDIAISASPGLLQTIRAIAAVLDAKGEIGEDELAKLWKENRDANQGPIPFPNQLEQNSSPIQ
jgi:hypothetical protein